jgi:hypothetical protein
MPASTALRHILGIRNSMNPLTWMRENQHKMLVFFTVMLMAGFGALGVMSSSVDRGSTYVPPEAKAYVKWKAGTTTDLELESVWRKRLAVQFYLTRLLEETQKLDPNFTPTESMMVGGVTPADAPAQARYLEAFNSLLMAEKAREMGVQVSDDTIDQKLARFTGNLLSRDDMRAIATEVGRNAGLMSYTDFREGLKREFMAMQTFVVGVENILPNTASPVAAFQYHWRMNRQVECQILPVNVVDFLEKVTETPSDSELRTLFEQGQFRYPSFDGTQPGFKIANRVKLEYFTADLSAMSREIAEALTADEVQAEYDKLLANQDPLVYTPASPLPNLDPTQTPLDLGPEFNLPGNLNTLPGSGVPPGGDLELPPLVPPVTEGAGTETQEKTETSTETSEGQESGSAEATEGAGEENAGEQTEENAGGQEAGGEDADGAGNAGLPPNPAQSTNYVSISRSADLTPSADQEQSGETEAQEAGGSTEQEGAASEQTSEAQTAETQETETQAAESTAGESGEAQTTQDGQAAAQDGAEGTEPTTPDSQEPKIRTLAEVEAELRNRMAIPKALERIDAGFQEIENKIRVFRSDYRIYKGDPEGEEEPEPIDYQGLAKQYGFLFAASPVMDQVTLAKTELGRTGAPNQTYAEALFLNFDQVAETPYTPQRINDQTLVWVTETFRARVGTFDEVRDRVVTFWKRNKARELALADAEAKSKQVTAEQRLKDVFPAAQETGAFSWYTLDFARGGVALSNVRGAERIGEEFMEAAVGLDVGQTGTAFNADRSIAYVIQKTANAGSSDDEIREQFFTSLGSFRDYPFQVGAILRQREFQAGSRFLENLRDEYEVNFLQ